MEEQKNETMETEDKEAGADTAADLEETVQQGADGQRTDEEVDEPEADGAEKDNSEADESEDAEEPGENTRTIPPIHQAGTGHRIGGQLLFKNEFTITKEVYLEFVKAFMGQYRKLYYIMGGVSIILGLFSIIGGAFSSGIVFLLVGIICLVMPFFLYKSSRDKKFAKQVANNGGKPLERRISFYSDALEIFSNNGAHSVFEYSAITKIISSKNLYVLVIQKKLSLLVPKDSFVMGNLEEWKVFMMLQGDWKIK